MNPYQNYKDSGIDGLASIPSHWARGKLKFVGSIRYGLGQPPKELENGIPIIRATNVERGRIVDKNMLYVDPSDVPTGRDAFLKENEIIVVRSGAYTADSAIVTRKYVGAVAGYDMVFTPTGINAKFLSYALLSHYVLNNQLYLERMRAAQPHLNAEELGETNIVIPSLLEQQVVAEFLDCKTAQIDTLIEKKQRQIDLLQEQSTALINHAVTKGLNPDAPMKDSGVEWLGEIPRHWEVKRFKHVATIRSGQVDPKDAKYKSMTLIAPNHIESVTGRLLGTETADEQGAESGKYLFEKGDVLYSKIRPELRKACIATCDGLCSADMYPIVPTSELLPEFLLYLLLSEPFSQFATERSMRVAMPKVNRDALDEYSFAFPSIDEQKDILNYINRESQIINGAIERSNREIKLIQEYRTALISEAVTGKIDVREWRKVIHE